ncbi:MAG: hypothetical protein V1792_04210 [Pseudomonadota bacterium]
MTAEPRRTKTPEPGTTRTDRDRVMIVLGVFLTLLLLAAGYVSIGSPDGNPAPRKRGPVKHPDSVGMLFDQGPSRLCFRLPPAGGIGSLGSTASAVGASNT